MDLRIEIVIIKLNFNCVYKEVYGPTHLMLTLIEGIFSWNKYRIYYTVISLEKII